MEWEICEEVSIVSQKHHSEQLMRIQLIAVCLFLSVFSELVAQNNLTGACNMPLAGDSICRQQIAYFPPGGYGVEQVWDFSGIEFMDDSQNIVFRCDTDATVLYAFEPERLFKYQMNRDSLLLMGQETALQVISYQPALTMLPLPCMYGDHTLQPFQGKGSYCLKYLLESNGTIETEADATGLICLIDEDTLRNVLRVHQILSSAIRQYLPDDTVIDLQNTKQRIEEHYLWYARGYRYPVFETESITIFNNMNPVSCQQRAYCTLPSEQLHLRDSVNHQLLESDSLALSQSQQSPIIHYSVSTEGNTLLIHYTLDADATINILISDKMGLVYRRESVSDATGTMSTLRMNCSGLKKDIYVLYMNVNGQIYSEKVEL